MDVYERKWEKGFVALTRFKARKGHCRVPKAHAERAYQLGSWVAAQRSSAKTMSAERRRRLDAIGFVWDCHEDAWKKGFAALIKFKAREGHCRVPRFYVEGNYNLGQWVSVQRYNKNNIDVECKQQLNKVGFVWDWRKDAWEKGFAALTKFKAREGHCRVPALHIERKFRLGRWVSMQRGSKNKMPAKCRTRLNDIGFVWRAD